jgi:hypothetical protein
MQSAGLFNNNFINKDPGFLAFTRMPVGTNPDIDSFHPDKPYLHGFVEFH